MSMTIRRSHLLIWMMLLLVAGCNKNKYPDTVQQTGSIYLQGCAKRIAMGIQNFYEEHGRWPVDLGEVIKEGEIASSDLRYPRTYDLPDRRDILKFTDNLEWIYMSPKDNPPTMPLVIAPRPFTDSMGKRLVHPKRIIVKLDSSPEAVDEDSIAAIVQSLPKP